MLGDLGARVIKVERPGTGDDARSIGPFTQAGSAYFASINRGKESIALDLKAEDDRAIFESLLAKADVLVENFRPGTLDSLGYGWEWIQAQHPTLVLTSVSGFGNTGPLRTKPAYDMVVQAMGGVMSITGPDGGPPTRVGTSIGDICAGMFASNATVAALLQVARSGVGCHVDVSMLDSQVALLENALARFSTTGEIPGPIGSRHPSITPFGSFESADDPLIIAAGNDSLFAQLCRALGAPEMASDVRFATNHDRCSHAKELTAAMEERLSTHSASHWLEALEAAGLPVAPVLDVQQVVNHPQTDARGMVLPVQGAAWDGLLVAGSPMHLSSQEPSHGGGGRSAGAG